MENLKIAEEICFQLFGKPKSHQEWANRFNQVGDVRKIINKYYPNKQKK